MKSLFKEGVIFTDEELEYIKSKKILNWFNNDSVNLSYINIDDLREISKLFIKNIKFFDCSYNKNLKNLICCFFFVNAFSISSISFETNF